MSSVSVWILSIVGIIILSILVDLIMPKSQTADFIKNIFAYIIVIVVLSPVLSFLTSKTFNIEEFFKNNVVVLQEDYISSINQQMVQQLENNIEKDIENIGLLGVKVGIKATIFEDKLAFTQVSIDLQDLVITQKDKHIDIKTSIISLVQQHINIEKESVVFYE